MENRPIMPQSVTSAPRKMKQAGYPAASTPKPKATVTSTVASTGSSASTASAVPRFSGTVTSVTQALNAASFEVEPKKVMTQSIIMTMLTVAATTLASSEIEKSLPIFEREINANTATVKPQIM